MVKFKFVTTLSYLEVTDTLDKDFTLMPYVDLITDKKKISEVVDDELLYIAGSIEGNHLLDANHIIFCELDDDTFPNNSRLALIIWLAWLDMLIHDSWLIKDNSIGCEVAYVKLIDGTHSEWSNNYLQNPSSLSNGKQYECTKFNLKEIIVWEKQSHRMQDYLHTKKSSHLQSFTDKKYSRIGRSRQFINAARKESHPAIKISHYCSAFESLFSTDNAELSHKLSERVAIFLKYHGFNPITVFDDMKQFYGIRSKVTHGDSIQSSKEQEIPLLSKTCDNYLRSIFKILLDDNKLLDIFEGDKNSFEKYFKELLLIGKDSSSYTKGFGRR